MKKIVLVFTGLVLMIYSLNVVALNGIHSFKGQIIDSRTKAPVAFAGIIIKDGSKLIATVADEDGSFILYDVSAGAHSIQINHSDYENAVAVITVSDDMEFAVNFELNKKLCRETEHTQVKDTNTFNSLFWNLLSPESFFSFLGSVLFSF
jgi:hypothetical protein